MKRFAGPQASLWADSAYSLAASLAGRGASFLLAVVIARSLGVETFGLYVLSVALGTLVYVAADGGLIPAALAEAQGNASLAAYLRRRLLCLQILYLTISIGVGLGAASILIEGKPTDRLAAGLIVIGFGLQSAARFARFPLLAAGRLRREVSMTMSERMLTALVGIIALLITNQLLAVAVVHAAIPLLTAGIAAGHVRYPHRSVPRYSIQKVATTGLRLGATSLASQAYGRIDTVILAVFVSASVLGIYGAAYALISSALILPAALYNMALANSLQANGGADAERFYLRHLQAVALTLAIGVAAAGPLLSHLIFALEYDQQLQTLFLLLGPAFFFMARNSSLNLMAVKYGASMWLLKLTGLGLAVNVLLCLLLIPTHGLTGAAAATLITELSIFVLSQRNLRKRQDAHE